MNGPEPVDALDHIRGATSDRARVTVIEYGDYDCPHTRAAQPELERLLAENPDVRYVFRHFPLRDAHANAEVLARVAEAAELQEKFWPMHEQLMHHHPIDDSGLAADARNAGVDLGALADSMDDEEVEAKIQHDMVEGRRAGVHSTPSFFFEGKLHDGPYDYETLRAALEAARARAGRASPRSPSTANGPR